MTYTWTDDAMQGGTACDVDKVNDNLMHLKYENTTPRDGKVVYSVNSGRIDTNGRPYLLYRIDNDTIGFRTPDGIPLVVTFPNGKSYTITDIPDVTLPGNVTYGVFLEEDDLTDNGDGTYSVSSVALLNIAANPVTEAYAFPASPATNARHLDISEIPYVSYKYDGVSWNENQFIKIGQVKRSGDVVATADVVTYAYNGFYISDWFAVAVDTAYSKSDDLGFNEKNIEILTNSGGTDSEVRASVNADSFYVSAVRHGTGCLVETDSINTHIYTGDYRITSGDSSNFASGALDLTSGYYKVIARRAF